MVEHAESIAQMWQENLGLDVTVEAGENVAIRERVRNRELDGNVYFCSNEGRWDGDSLMRSMHYLDSSLRQSEDPDLAGVADVGYLLWIWGFGTMPTTKCTGHPRRSIIPSAPSTPTFRWV